MSPAIKVSIKNDTTKEQIVTGENPRCKSEPAKPVWNEPQVEHYQRKLLKIQPKVEEVVRYVKGLTRESQLRHKRAVAYGTHTFKYASENVPVCGCVNGSVRWMLTNTTEKMNHPTVQTHPTQTR
jgi:hypothetical protein